MKKLLATLKYLALIILAVVLVAAIYVGFVFATYNRYEDNIVLTPEKKVDIKPSTGEEYTIVSQNIGFGAYVKDYSFFMDGGIESRARSVESIYDVFNQAENTINSFDPDFLLFQEVDFDSTRSLHVDEPKLIKEKYPTMDYVFGQNYHSAYLMYPILRPHGKANSGLCTLSDYSIESAIRRSIPVTDSVSKILDLDRCYTVSRVPMNNGKELIIYNVHLSAYATGGNIKERQIEALVSDIQSEYDKGNYCVAGGDYNADFTGDSVASLNNGLVTDMGWCQRFPSELLTENMRLCTDYSCGEERPSCRNCDKGYEDGDFTIIVDGFIVTDNVEVTYLENVQTGFAYSDHNPVAMKFVLK